MAAVATLVLSGTAVAVAATGRGGTTYRTTTVRLADVTQLLNLTGTVAVVNHASASFPVAGTLATVNAQVGDTVRAGQVLASLTKAPLTDAVTQATAQLAQTQATLQTDQAASASNATAAAIPTPAATIKPTATRATASTGRSASVSITTGQGIVGQAQRRATQAMTRALHAVNDSQLACGPTPLATGHASPTPTLRPSNTDSSTPSPATTTSPGTGPDICLTSQATTLSALQSLARTQQALSTAQQALTFAMAAASASGTVLSSMSTTRIATGTTPSSTARTASSSTSVSRSSSGSQSVQASAARVTLDQAAILAAQAALEAAHRNLIGSTLTSPIAGTVASQPFIQGASEAVGTSLTIFGPGAVEVTANVAATSLTLVKVGQSASIIANGATAPVQGTVTAIGLLPAASNSNTNSYPITILIAQPSKAFVSGAAAAVTLIVKTVSQVVSVPDSAVTLTPGRAFVNVLTAGKPVHTAVQIGAIGALLTEITTGVKAGQVLVLADPTVTLPASSATLPSIRQFGPGAGGGRGGTGGAGQQRPGG
jgi:multidrug efflux pump subunit AcrA (membrane-fusion protein)